MPDDRPVVFSAHGVPKSVPAAAQDRGLTYVDATCPLVSKVHRQAERLIAQLRGNDGKDGEDSVTKHIQQVAGQHSTEFNAEQLASLSQEINSGEAKRMIN